MRHCIDAGFLAHLSRRLIGELKGYSWSGARRRTSTISNFNISTTSCPIVTKFYLKYHCVGGKDALGFGPRSDQNSGVHGNR